MERQELETLWLRAQAALEAGAWDEAFDSARALEAWGHASAFEVRARAQWGRGQTAQALETLAQGIARAPAVWRLWELFGIFQGEVGQLDAADASLRNALRCPEAEPVSIGYHSTLLRVRQGRLAEALEMAGTLRELAPPDLGARLDLLRARILNALGRHEEALELLDGTLEHGEESPGGDDVITAGLYLERGKAHWLGSESRAAALADLRTARALAAGARGPAGGGAGLGLEELDAWLSEP